MTAQIYLMASEVADTPDFPNMLKKALAAAPVSALLIRRGARPEAAYAEIVRKIVPVAQKADCAVLVEDLPDLVTALGADGVHVTGGLAELKKAVKALKPDHIVGAGNIHSRHDAMLAGEAEADYLLFEAGGDQDAADARALAQWWAEAFEIPAVYAFAEGEREEGTGKAEFIALDDAVWAASEGPGTALKALAERLGATR